MSKTTIEGTVGQAEDFTENELKLMALQDLKDAVRKMHKLKMLNRTQTNQLSLIYSSLMTKCGHLTIFD